MLNKTRAALGFGLFSLLTVLPLDAQEVATVALRNGQRPSGELVDLNARGIILRINGQEQAFALGDVQSLEFVVGGVPAEAQNKINAGQPFVLLRSGQVIDGRLVDIGGNRPLRITIETGSGSRDFNSSDVSQVWVNPTPSQPAQAGTIPGATPPGTVGTPMGRTITVPANVAWTDTGLAIARGLKIQVNATGDIALGPGMGSGIAGSPAVTVPTARYPVRNAYAGALIGRVGNGAPFLIGGNTAPIEVKNTGRLYLGVNDDILADNFGEYTVSVTLVR